MNYFHQAEKSKSVSNSHRDINNITFNINLNSNPISVTVINEKFDQMFNPVFEHAYNLIHTKYFVAGVGGNASTNKNTNVPSSTSKTPIMTTSATTGTNETNNNSVNNKNEQTQTENQKSESQSQSQSILFRCPIDFDKDQYGYFTFDIQGKRDTEDPNLQHLYEFDKLSPTQRLDFHRDWTKIILPEDLSNVRQAHLDAYKTGIYKTKFRVKLPVSNKIVWIQTCGNVIFDMEGNPRLISGLNAIVD